MSTTHRIHDTKLQNQVLDLDSEHLSIEVLGAYHREALSQDEMNRTRRHLVLCGECSETLLDLVQFLKSSAKPSRLWSAELTAAWEEWLASLGERQASSSLDRELVPDEA